MSGFLSRRISRRKLLLSGGAVAAFGAASTASALTLPQLQEGSEAQLSNVREPPPGPQPVQVLQHDAVQEGDAFARGTRLYSLGLEGGQLRGPGVFESEIMAAPFPFTHSVLRWNSHLATFEFRTSADGVTWPDWRWSYLDGASMEETEGESTLVGAPRHRFLQYRARLAEGGSIWRVTAIFLNAADGPVIDQAVAPETGRPGAIDFSRADWGCDDRVRFDGGGQELDPRKFVAVDKLILHHTVTPENYEDSIAEVRALYTYHARILGWGDLGYHVLIDRFGRSYEGRLGRSAPDTREVFSPGVVGAHASGYNFGTSGVALIGQFHGEGAQLVPQAMLDRAVDVLEHAARQSYIDPLGSSDFLLSTGEWRRGMPNLAGHRDCNYTSCPGDNAYGLLEEVRARVAARLAMQPAPWLDVRQPATHGNLRFDWAGSEGSEYSYHLQGWSHRGKGINYLTGYWSDLSPMWSDWTRSTSVSFPGLPPGFWTMHVRARNEHGETYKATKSVVVDDQLQLHL
jgi:hypothetical protein